MCVWVSVYAFVYYRLYHTALHYVCVYVQCEKEIITRAEYNITHWMMQKSRTNEQCTVFSHQKTAIKESPVFSLFFFFVFSFLFLMMIIDCFCVAGEFYYERFIMFEHFWCVLISLWLLLLLLFFWVFNFTLPFHFTPDFFLLWIACTRTHLACHKPVPNKWWMIDANHVKWVYKRK